MYNVLSIDWDYFIDVDNDTRNRCFPAIQKDIITKEEREYIWRYYYESYNIDSVSILEDDYNRVCGILQRQCKDLIKFYENDSHRYIYNALKENELFPVTVYNIDHHHDMYQYREPLQIVNCSNWAYILQEEYGDRYIYKWMKREDSEEYSLAGKIDCGTFNLSDIENESFDMVFLCKSGAWSPMHLDDRYQQMKAILAR